ncbi:hypothetical protein BFP72_16590 [Reichenbachiella sp. 5M10]|uniref:response regulator n=1 Tax=Reichenbachiella sp. 5M10 TaxID=1889772 RepID=UPI000C151C41|nr:response regulator [Reichenbachiella sp. 5M10]PIB36906.1 hypothetical protein BFP72_16590 [Reichenbachiella sp. 5M10]
MNAPIDCILLIDDNPDDNFFHERVIRKGNYAKSVVAIQSGQKALDYLISRDAHPDKHPQLILLDINMPGMNGWEFIEEYKKLDLKFQSQIMVIMLTTSTNPDDQTKAESLDLLSEFKTKPLTTDMMDEIVKKHFS